MSKRFIIALNSSTTEQNESFLQVIKENSFGWWHHLENFWLLKTHDDEATAESVGQHVEKIYPGVYKLVLELSKDNDSWHGFGPNGDPKEGQANMFTWLHGDWTK